MLANMNQNLLHRFDAVMTGPHVMRAARVPCTTSPTVSNATNRMGYALNDPLFITTQGKTLPTPSVRSIWPAPRNVFGPERSDAKSRFTTPVNATDRMVQPLFIAEIKRQVRGSARWCTRRNGQLPAVPRQLQARNAPRPALATHPRYRRAALAADAIARTRRPATQGSGAMCRLLSLVLVRRCLWVAAAADVAGMFTKAIPRGLPRLWSVAL